MKIMNAKSTRRQALKQLVTLIGTVGGASATWAFPVDAQHLLCSAEAKWLGMSSLTAMPAAELLVSPRHRDKVEQLQDLYSCRVVPLSKARSAVQLLDERRCLEVWFADSAAEVSSRFHHLNLDMWTRPIEEDRLPAEILSREVEFVSGAASALDVSNAWRLAVRARIVECVLNLKLSSRVAAYVDETLDVSASSLVSLDVVEYVLRLSRRVEGGVRHKVNLLPLFKNQFIHSAFAHVCGLRVEESISAPLVNTDQLLTLLAESASMHSENGLNALRSTIVLDKICGTRIAC